MNVGNLKSQLRLMLKSLEDVSDDLPTQTDVGELSSISLTVNNEDGFDVSHPKVDDKVPKFVEVTIR